MTKLLRLVRRDAAAGRRALVVTLHPPNGSMSASMGLREKRRRTGYRITLDDLFYLLARRAMPAKKGKR